MTVTASFYETETLPNGGRQQGQFLDTATMNVVIPSLEEGRDNSFVVYVIASDPNHVCEVRLPDAASYITLGNNERQQAKFLPTTLDILSLPAAPLRGDGHA